MTAAVHVPLRLVTCLHGCPTGTTRSHHDRLLAVDTDPAALLELVDLAVTWHELDYSQAAVVAPAEWETFAARHRWVHPERAEQAFLLACDIVARSGPRPRTAGRSTLDLATG